MMQNVPPLPGAAPYFGLPTSLTLLERLHGNSNAPVIVVYNDVFAAGRHNGAAASPGAVAVLWANTAALEAGRCMAQGPNPHARLTHLLSADAVFFEALLFQLQYLNSGTHQHGNALVVATHSYRVPSYARDFWRSLGAAESGEMSIVTVPCTIEPTSDTIQQHDTPFTCCLFQAPKRPAYNQAHQSLSFSGAVARSVPGPDVPLQALLLQFRLSGSPQPQRAPSQHPQMLALAAQANGSCQAVSAVGSAAVGPGGLPAPADWPAAGYSTHSAWGVNGAPALPPPTGFTSGVSSEGWWKRSCLILSALPVCVTIFDLRGSVLFQNAASIEYFGQHLPSPCFDGANGAGRRAEAQAGGPPAASKPRGWRRVLLGSRPKPLSHSHSRDHTPDARLPSKAAASLMCRLLSRARSSQASNRDRRRAEREGLEEASGPLPGEASGCRMPAATASGAITSGADGDGDGGSGGREPGLLQELFSLEPSKLELMWNATMCEGDTWQGIVRVPKLLNPDASASSALSDSSEELLTGEGGLPSGGSTGAAPSRSCVSTLYTTIIADDNGADADLKRELGSSTSLPPSTLYDTRTEKASSHSARRASMPLLAATAAAAGIPASSTSAASGSGAGRVAFFSSSRARQLSRLGDPLESSLAVVPRSRSDTRSAAQQEQAAPESPRGTLAGRHSRSTGRLTTGAVTGGDCGGGVGVAGEGRGGPASQGSVVLYEATLPAPSDTQTSPSTQPSLPAAPKRLKEYDRGSDSTSVASFVAVPSSEIAEAQRSDASANHTTRARSGTMPRLNMPSSLSATAAAAKVTEAAASPTAQASAKGAPKVTEVADAGVEVRAANGGAVASAIPNTGDVGVGVSGCNDSTDEEFAVDVMAAAYGMYGDGDTSVQHDFDNRPNGMKTASLGATLGAGPSAGHVAAAMRPWLLRRSRSRPTAFDAHAPAPPSPAGVAAVVASLPRSWSLGIRLGRAANAGSSQLFKARVAFSLTAASAADGLALAVADTSALSGPAANGGASAGSQHDTASQAHHSPGQQRRFLNGVPPATSNEADPIDMPRSMGTRAFQSFTAGVRRLVGGTLAESDTLQAASRASAELPPPPPSPPLARSCPAPPAAQASGSKGSTGFQELRVGTGLPVKPQHDSPAQERPLMQHRLALPAVLALAGSSAGASKLGLAERGLSRWPTSAGMSDNSSATDSGTTASVRDGLPAPGEPKGRPKRGLNRRFASVYSMNTSTWQVAFSSMDVKATIPRAINRATASEALLPMSGLGGLEDTYRSVPAPEGPRASQAVDASDSFEAGIDSLCLQDALDSVIGGRAQPPGVSLHDTAQDLFPEPPQVTSSANRSGQGGPRFGLGLAVGGGGVGSGVGAVTAMPAATTGTSPGGGSATVVASGNLFSTMGSDPATDKLQPLPSDLQSALHSCSASKGQVIAGRHMRRSSTATSLLAPRLAATLAVQQQLLAGYHSQSSDAASRASRRLSIDSNLTAALASNLSTVAPPADRMPPTVPSSGPAPASNTAVSGAAGAVSSRVLVFAASLRTAPVLPRGPGTSGSRPRSSSRTRPQRTSHMALGSAQARALLAASASATGIVGRSASMTAGMTANTATQRRALLAARKTTTYLVGEAALSDGEEDEVDEGDVRLEEFSPRGGAGPGGGISRTSGGGAQGQSAASSRQFASGQPAHGDAGRARARAKSHLLAIPSAVVAAVDRATRRLKTRASTEQQLRDVDSARAAEGPGSTAAAGAGAGASFISTSPISWSQLMRTFQRQSSTTQMSRVDEAAQVSGNASPKAGRVLRLLEVGGAVAAGAEIGRANNAAGSLGAPSGPTESTTPSAAASDPANAANAALSSECWHEVVASRLVDPASGVRAVVLLQRDVSAKVVAERHVAQVSETEHRLLEQIFPRHVLQYIMEEAGVGAAAPVAAATGQAARSSSDATGGDAPADALMSSFTTPGWRPYIRDCNRLATWHPKVTVLFADIQGFTPMCKVLPPRVVMSFLNNLFTRFDAMLDEYHVYKVETIGDCYMVAGGLIREDEDGMAAVRGGGHVDQDQAANVFAFAKAMLRAASCVRLPTSGEPVKVRVGIHSGPVVSGVVGTRMPRFCLFGDTVNTASRMESNGVPGAIHVSEDCREMMRARGAAAVEGFVPTNGIEVKGKGLMSTFVWHPPGYRSTPAAIPPAASEPVSGGSGSRTSTQPNPQSGPQSGPQQQPPRPAAPGPSRRASPPSLPTSTSPTVSTWPHGPVHTGQGPRMPTALQPPAPTARGPAGRSTPVPRTHSPEPSAQARQPVLAAQRFTSLACIPSGSITAADGFGGSGDDGAGASRQPTLSAVSAGGVGSGGGRRSGSMDNGRPDARALASGAVSNVSGAASVGVGSVGVGSGCGGLGGPAAPVLAAVLSACRRSSSDGGGSMTAVAASGAASGAGTSSSGGPEGANGRGGGGEGGGAAAPDGDQGFSLEPRAVLPGAPRASAGVDSIPPGGFSALFWSSRRNAQVRSAGGGDNGVTLTAEKGDTARLPAGQQPAAKAGARAAYGGALARQLQACGVRTGEDRVDDPAPHHYHLGGGGGFGGTCGSKPLTPNARDSPQHGQLMPVDDRLTSPNPAKPEIDDNNLDSMAALLRGSSAGRATESNRAGAVSGLIKAGMSNVSTCSSIALADMLGLAVVTGSFRQSRCGGAESGAGGTPSGVMSAKQGGGGREGRQKEGGIRGGAARREGERMDAGGRGGASHGRDMGSTTSGSSGGRSQAVDKSAGVTGLAAAPGTNAQGGRPFVDGNMDVHLVP